jgi:uncharacterized membrane protein
MDTRTIAATLLKVAGLVIITYTVSQLPSYFPVRLGGEQGYSIAAAMLEAAFTLLPSFLLGICFWFLPGTITNKVVAPHQTADDPANIEVIERVAISVLGLYLVAHGISDLIYNLTTLYQLRRQFPDQEVMPARPVAGLVSSAAEGLIGLVIVLRSKGVANVLQKLRG